MRRPVIAGALLSLMLAALPFTGHAATARVTVLSPTSGDVATDVVSIRWSYAAFHPTTPVDIEAKQGNGPFARIARVSIDDGSAGSFGSYAWDTTTVADAADYTLRVIVPTNKSVFSTVSPVGVDNTGPGATVDAEPLADGLPPAAVLAPVTGTATDNVSGVASVVVTFTDEDGNETTRQADCTDCGTTETTWSVATDGLEVGEYTVSAVATDVVGNVGPAASVDGFVIVGRPSVEMPPTTTTSTSVPTPTTTSTSVPTPTTTSTSVPTPTTTSTSVPTPPTTLPETGD